MIRRLTTLILLVLAIAVPRDGRLNAADPSAEPPGAEGSPAAPEGPAAFEGFEAVEAPEPPALATEDPPPGPFADFPAPAVTAETMPADPTEAVGLTNGAPTLPGEVPPGSTSDGFQRAPASAGMDQSPSPAPTAETAPPPEAARPPDSVGETSPRDERVELVDVPEGADLPPARMPPEGAEVPQNAPAGDPFIVSPERLREGPNSVGLTVQVKAPQVANLNLESTVEILVKNSGPAEASNVMVRYPLPEGLEFVGSEPPRVRFDGQTQFWQLNTLAPGAERTIKVKVKYLRAGAYDHGVIVTLQGGAKARTQARQPQLKAEVRVDKTTVLKDESVRFDVTVSNFGDLPARDVVIQAKLGAGLQHDAGRELIYSLKREQGRDALAPGQSVTLPLIVRAQAMGQQACEVSITSPDEPRAIQAHGEVEVTAPQLEVALDGPSERYPDSLATYTVTVTNQGTAPARKVIVAIRVPIGGKPDAAEPRGALWKPETRTLYWQLESLPASESQAFKIRVKMGDVGTLNVQAGATAQGLTQIFRTKVTSIQGIPRVRFTVYEPRGVLDVGEETEYQIRLINEGSAEARDVSVKATFSDHLQVLSVSGADAKAPVAQEPKDGVAVLPLVASLPAGGEVTLSVQVKAVKEGTGACEVVVSHKDLGPDVGVKTTTVTRITPASGIQRQ